MKCFVNSKCILFLLAGTKQRHRWVSTHLSAVCFRAAWWNANCVLCAHAQSYASNKQSVLHAGHTYRRYWFVVVLCNFMLMLHFHSGRACGAADGFTVSRLFISWDRAHNRKGLYYAISVYTEVLLPRLFQVRQQKIIFFFHITTVLNSLTQTFAEMDLLRAIGRSIQRAIHLFRGSLSRRHEVLLW